MTEAVIEIREAETGYGRLTVLRDVDLAVAGGEVVAVVGPNGAGKSTLMRLIAGVLPPWRGSIRFDGRDIGRLGVEARAEAGIILCPEGRRIFATLSIEENLLLGAEPMRRRRGAGFAGAVRERLEHAYAMFPVLKERRKSSGGALSGGQQQMLAIARALMSEPQILLLDEPSLGLSPAMADEVYATLTELKSAGLTIVVVEEAAGRPLKLADRAIVMRNGAVIHAGETRALRETGFDIAAAYVGLPPS